MTTGKYRVGRRLLKEGLVLDLMFGFGQVEVAWLLRLRNLSAKNTVVVVILKTGKAQKAA